MHLLRRRLSVRSKLSCQYIPTIYMLYGLSSPTLNFVIVFLRCCNRFCIAVCLCRSLDTCLWRHLACCRVSSYYWRLWIGQLLMWEYTFRWWLVYHHHILTIWTLNVLWLRVWCAMWCDVNNIRWACVSITTDSATRVCRVYDNYDHSSEAQNRYQCVRNYQANRVEGICCSYTGKEYRNWQLYWQ